MKWSLLPAEEIASWLWKQVYLLPLKYTKKGTNNLMKGSVQFFSVYIIACSLIHSPPASTSQGLSITVVVFLYSPWWVRPYGQADILSSALDTLTYLLHTSTVPISTLTSWGWVCIYISSQKYAMPRRWLIETLLIMWPWTSSSSSMTGQSLEMGVLCLHSQPDKPTMWGTNVSVFITVAKHLT